MYQDTVAPGDPATLPRDRDQDRDRDRDTMPRDRDSQPEPREADDDGITLGDIISTIVVGAFRAVLGLCWAVFSAIAYLARRHNR